jgi:YD repeat-containing protein
MIVKKSITLCFIVISTSFASNHSKLKSSNGGGLSFPPTNNTQIMSYQPETGNFTKEIPIINTSLNDGLNFNYSIYLNNYGQISVPLIMSMGNTAGGYNLIGFVRDVNGKVNTLSSGVYGGNVTSNSHFYGTIKDNGPYSIYSSNGVLYTGDVYNNRTSYIYSPHKKSAITLSYGNAQDYIRSGTSDKLCSYGETGVLLSKITLPNNYTVTFGVSSVRVYGYKQRYKCTSVNYDSVSESKGRKWIFKLNELNGSLQNIKYPDGRTIIIDPYSPTLITDINGVQYKGGSLTSKLQLPYVNYSGANLTQSLKESFTGDSSNINNTIKHMDGSEDKYLGYPMHYAISANPGNGSYKEHQKLDKSGKIIYDEVNTWAYTSNKIPYLLTQIITQDGVTVSKKFDGYDSYLFPKTITEISSDGKTRTTTTTYSDIPTSSTHGHMVVPETIKVTDSKNKVIHLINNVYDTEGYLMSSTVDGIQTKYTYDSDSNLATVTDASGNITKYQAYQYGKPTVVIDPKGNKTTYSYDYRGLVLSKTDAKNNDTTYTYDIDGRPKSITPPAGFATTYTYSSNGLTVTKKQGAVTTVTIYDGLGRILSSTISSSTGSMAKTIKYDTMNNKVFMSYPCASASRCKTGDIYTYDLLGRPIQLVKDTSSF